MEGISVLHDTQSPQTSLISAADILKEKDGADSIAFDHVGEFIDYDEPFSCCIKLEKGQKCFPP